MGVVVGVGLSVGSGVGVEGLTTSIMEVQDVVAKKINKSKQILDVLFVFIL